MRIIKDNKGFTLVELMVVVLIIGILVAIAIPIFNNASKKAKINTCLANIRTIDGAISQAATTDGNTLAQEATNGGDSVETGALTVDKLVKGGYLKSAPECPFGDTYVIDVDKGSVTPHSH